MELVQDGLRTNPGNAKVHFTMGNVLTQQVCGYTRAHLCRREVCVREEGRERGGAKGGAWKRAVDLAVLGSDVFSTPPIC